MGPRRARLVLGAFACLGAAAIANLLLLQPQSHLAQAGQRPGVNALAFSNATDAPKAAAAATPADATRLSEPASRAAALASRAGALARATNAPAPSSRAMTLASAHDAKGAPVAANAPGAPGAGPAASPAPASLVSAGPDTIRAVQRELRSRGYEPGSSDGVPGLITRAAVIAYEWDHGLALTAEPSEALLQRILLGEGLAPPSGASLAPTRTREAEGVIRTVQQSLARVGFKIAKPDGRIGDDTMRAIREFEVEQGLPETGRVSGQLVARLARLAGQGRFTGTP